MTKPEAAAYRRGYEAALRKVWREFIQVTRFSGSRQRQTWRFAGWRSWVIPSAWRRDDR